MSQSPPTSYDEIPYPSYAFRQTRPDHLACIGKFFGMKTVDFRKARILELGCARGANLLPMAAAFPNSAFLGIDLSDRQIKEGRQDIAELNLKNVELKTLSIMDVDASFGTFDFIIAHGIYSWVSEDVRNQILAICKNNLSTFGIAYVSYNTLPGWNMVKTIRDMMLYHSGSFNDPAARILEARRMLNFTLENCSGGETPYKQMLENEVDVISKAADNYLFHDHLEHQNDPCYFHEFIGKANGVGLQYVGDAQLATMYVGIYSETAREKLGQINDLVRQEQYLDFLTNRRFRATLLCHADAKLSRNILPEGLDEFLYMTTLSPKGGIDNVDLLKDGETEFSNSATGQSLKTSSRVVAAAFCVLAESNSRPMSVDELIKKASSRLENIPEDVIRKSFLESAGRFILNGCLEIALDAGNHVSDVSDQPEVWAVARLMARSDNSVPSVLHKNVVLGDDLRVLVPYVDGTRTVEDIVEAYLPHFLNGDLTLNVDGVPATDENKIRTAIGPVVTNGLHALAVNSLLVA